MESAFTDWLPFEWFEALLSAPFGELWLALAFLGVTASVYASGVPGALLPLSFSSGALLGGLLGMASVAGGALVGSLVLYELIERGSRKALRQKYADRLDKLGGRLAQGGIMPIVGLRLAGVPHLAVTALCAVGSVGVRRYALATFFGTFPAIALSASAGAAF